MPRALLPTHPHHRICGKRHKNEQSSHQTTPEAASSIAIPSPVTPLTTETPTLTDTDAPLSHEFGMPPARPAHTPPVQTTPPAAAKPASLQSHTDVIGASATPKHAADRTTSSDAHTSIGVMEQKPEHTDEGEVTTGALDDASSYRIALAKKHSPQCNKVKATQKHVTRKHLQIFQKP